MAMDPNDYTQIVKPLYLADNKPVDVRTQIADLSEYETLTYPYLGMLFYAVQEEKYYKVTSLQNGYLVYSTNTTTRVQPAGTEYVDYEIVPNLYIGQYEEFSSGGGSELTIDGYDIEENGEILRHTLDEFRSEKSNGDTFVITKDSASMVVMDTNGLLKKASEISSLGAGGQSINYDGNDDIDNVKAWSITHAGVKLGEESPTGSKGLTATEQGIKGETKNHENVVTSFYDVDTNGLKTSGLQGNVEVTPSMIDIEDGQGKGVQIKHDRIILNDGVEPITLFKPPASGVIATHEWVTASVGQPPYIGVNGNWYVGGIDSGVKAEGTSIESVVKTSTSGNVDTYTITYSDTTTSTFEVTNGDNAVSWNFKGTLDTYADLLLVTGMIANDAYLVSEKDEDGTRYLYIYNGTSFPLEGEGLPYGGSNIEFATNEDVNLKTKDKAVDSELLSNTLGDFREKTNVVREVPYTFNPTDSENIITDYYGIKPEILNGFDYINHVKLKCARAGNINIYVFDKTNYSTPFKTISVISSGNTVQTFDLREDVDVNNYLIMISEGACYRVESTNETCAIQGGVLYPQNTVRILMGLSFVGSGFDPNNSTSFTENLGRIVDNYVINGELGEDISVGTTEFTTSTSNFSAFGYSFNRHELENVCKLNSIDVGSSVAIQREFVLGTIDQWGKFIVKESWVKDLVIGNNNIILDTLIRPGEYLGLKYDGQPTTIDNNQAVTPSVAWATAGFDGIAVKDTPNSMPVKLNLTPFVESIIATKDEVVAVRTETQIVSNKLSGYFTHNGQKVTLIFNQDGTVNWGTASTINKVLHLGNSILIHSIQPYWWGLWGMAASTRENDYAHKFNGMLNVNDSHEENIAVWEAQQLSYNLTQLDSITPADLDLIVIRLGENVGDYTDLEQAYNNLISYLKTRCPNARIVIGGQFWTNAPKEAIIQSVATSNNLTYVQLYQFDNSTNKSAIGAQVYGDDNQWHSVDNNGVANHPNDTGMLNIATTLFNAL